LEKLYKLSNLQFPSDNKSQLEMISGCEELIKLVGNVKELNLKGVDSLSRLEIVQELDLDLSSEETDSPLQKDSTWALDQSPSRRENYFITKSV
jgi:Asp-tRNA(Asn)/Glu-tRNA(Gln) amidotransferase C subunit